MGTWTAAELSNRNRINLFQNKFTENAIQNTSSVLAGKVHKLIICTLIPNEFHMTWCHQNNAE